MAKFNLENYETVEDRLKVFWNENPEGRIETDIIHITQDGSCVTIQAQIYKIETDARPVSTGIAQETKGQGGFANADAWMENCETSAIGRALANWKYQGSNKPRPSKEEMSKVGNQEDKVQVTKVDMRKKENKADEELLAESMAKFEESIGYNEDSSLNKAKQIANIINGFGLNAEVEKKVKAKSFKQFTEAGNSKDVEEWDNDTIGQYIDLFEQLIPEVESEPSIEDVVGQVFDTTTVKVCPHCNKSDYIEDNREKKASDEKFKNIPDFTCSSYNSDGCGWGGYIGSSNTERAVPDSWL